jgi:hypothetical protein
MYRLINDPDAFVYEPDERIPENKVTEKEKEDGTDDQDAQVKGQEENPHYSIYDDEECTDKQCIHKGQYFRVGIIHLIGQFLPGVRVQIYIRPL